MARIVMTRASMYVWAVGEIKSAGRFSDADLFTLCIYHEHCCTGRKAQNPTFALKKCIFALAHDTYRSVAYR
jgi:hypothetical protein